MCLPFFWGWGWDRETKKLASSCQSPKLLAMKNINPKIREREITQKNSETEKIYIITKPVNLCNQIQSRERASYSYCARSWCQQTNPSRKNNFPWGSKCYKTIGSYVSCAFIEIWSTWEVWRALKKLELLSATPRATLTHLSCSPNFPRTSYLDERTLTYEPIVKFRPPFIQGTPDEKVINTIELKSFHVRQDRPQCFFSR